MKREIFEIINHIRSIYVVIMPSRSFMLAISFSYHTMNFFLSVVTTFLWAVIHFSADAANQAITIDYWHGEGHLSGMRLAYQPYHSQIAPRCKPLI